MEAIALQGVASLVLRNLIGRVFVGSLQHTKYISCVPHGCREEDILSLPHYKSIGAVDPWGMTSLDPVP